MRSLTRKFIGVLLFLSLISIVAMPQTCSAAGENISTFRRDSGEVIQGSVKTGYALPYVDVADGFSYTIIGSQTGSVRNAFATAPLSFQRQSGILLGANPLLNLSSSDDIYSKIRAEAQLRTYNPASYTLLGSTKLESGVIANLISSDNQYMRFGSYGERGLRFSDNASLNYHMDAGNGGSVDITGSFTIEFRVKWNQPFSTYELNHRFDIIGKWEQSPYKGYNVYFVKDTSTSVKLNGEVGNGTRWNCDSNDGAILISNGTWYHVAFVNNNGHVAVYFNGARMDHEYYCNPFSTSQNLLIGKIISDANHVSIDEVAIWKVAKWSPDQSSFQVPTKTYFGNESNLVALWHLDEGSGGYAYDSSSNSNHASVYPSGRTPSWVDGYPFTGEKKVQVEFSGFTAFSIWRALNWTLELGWNTTSVSVTLQLFNYTSGGYSVSGNGYLRYDSSPVAGTDETKTQTITVNPGHFRNPSTGEWKIKVTGVKTMSTGGFQLKCDLAEYSMLKAPVIDYDFTSILADRNIRNGLSTLNISVEAKCNITSLSQNLYLFNYSKNAFELRNTFATGLTDAVISVNVTAGSADYISVTGEMQIKLNSTYQALYEVSVDLVIWDLRYNEPSWEINWRVGYEKPPDLSRDDIIKLAVKLKSNLNRTAEVAHLSLLNYSASSWVTVIGNVNHTSPQIQWYNTTSRSNIDGFIGSGGCLNVSMYVIDSNWTSLETSVDQLVIYAESLTPDSIPPAIITDLAAGSPTANSITLTWTATGDDGNDGTATGYVVKYSTAGPINSSNWNSAPTYTQIPVWSPQPAGSPETRTISGLQSGTRYWFAIKVYDEVPSYSQVSNSPSTSTTDITAPASITDLIACNPKPDSITLNWTATGDDGATGRAMGYTVRYSTQEPINASNWDLAATYSQLWTPQPAGGHESYTIYGLNTSTAYWFAVVAYDETPNYGGVSNSVGETTTATSNGGNTGNTGPGFDITLVILPAVLVGVGVGAAGLIVVKRRSRLIPKTPFKKRVKTPERILPPKLREYVGESGVIPQPPKRAKFEEEGNTTKRKEE